MGGKVLCHLGGHERGGKGDMATEDKQRKSLGGKKRREKTVTRFGVCSAGKGPTKQNISSHREKKKDPGQNETVSEFPKS